MNGYGLHGSKLRLSIDGWEKICARCRDWWPADLEFFYADPKGAGGLYLYCKACYLEHIRPGASRRAQPALPTHFTTALLSAALAEAWSTA